MPSDPPEPNAPQKPDSTPPTPAAPAAARPSPWRLALGTAAVAIVLTWAAGEAAVFAWPPLSEGDKTKSMMQGGGITSELADRAAIGHATLAYGLQGALLGLVLGLAGTVAAPSGRSRRLAGPVGLVLGGAVGAAAAFFLGRLYYRGLGPSSDDLTMPLLTNGGIWAPIGAAGGLALGLGLGVGRGRLARGAVGGAVGALLGTVAYEVLGALLFPLAGTNQPVASSPSARALAHTLVNTLVALVATFAVADARRAAPKETRPTS